MSVEKKNVMNERQKRNEQRGKMQQKIGQGGNHTIKSVEEWLLPDEAGGKESFPDGTGRKESFPDGTGWEKCLPDGTGEKQCYWLPDGTGRTDIDYQTEPVEQI